MSLTLSQLEAIFKDFGKIIYLGQTAQDQVAVLEDICLQTAGQFAANADPANDFSFNLLIKWQQPLLSGIQTLIAQENAVGNLVKAATDNYLLQIGNDINASGSTSVSTIAALLPAALVNGSGSVLTQTSQGEYSGFYEYFFNNYNIALPQSGSPTFPDSWIEVTIV